MARRPTVLFANLGKNPAVVGQLVEEFRGFVVLPAGPLTDQRVPRGLASVDVVVLYADRLGLTGLESIRLLRRAAASVPVVVVCAEPSVENAKESIRLGAFAYVAAPFLPGTLRRLVTLARRCKPWSLREELQNGCLEQAGVGG